MRVSFDALKHGGTRAAIHTKFTGASKHGARMLACRRAVRHGGNRRGLISPRVQSPRPDGSPGTQRRSAPCCRYGPRRFAPRSVDLTLASQARPRPGMTRMPSSAGEPDIASAGSHHAGRFQALRAEGREAKREEGRVGMARGVSRPVQRVHDTSGIAQSAGGVLEI